MRVPGGNLLNMAMRVIAKQNFQYLKFIARVTNEVGYDIPTYAQPVAATGSIQPIPRSMYEVMGLDFQKNYFNFFLSKSVIDIARDVSGDHFIFDGKTYQCLSKTDWFTMDGWDQVLCVEVNDEQTDTQYIFSGSDLILNDSDYVIV